MWAFLRLKTLTVCNGHIWQTLLYNKIYKSYQPYSAKPTYFLHGHQHCNDVSYRGKTCIMGVYGEKRFQI
jgi:hypothetical protein